MEQRQRAKKSYSINLKCVHSVHRNGDTIKFDVFCKFGVVFVVSAFVVQVGWIIHDATVLCVSFETFSG